MKTPGFAWLLLVVAAVVTAACGDSKSSLNPTAPSALSSGSLNANADNAEESEATGNNGNGKGNGNGGNNGNGGPPAIAPGHGGSGNPSPSAPGQTRVEIEGLLTTVGTSSIEVNGQTVQVTSDTVIRHGNRRFELAELKPGDRVHVRAARLASMALQAVEIKLQNPGDPVEGELVVPTGLVSVTAADGAAAEWPTAGGTDTGTFLLTRAGDASLLAAPLTVTFTLSGTATNGSDYTNVPLTATFAAGVTTADVVVSPLNDDVPDGEETVVLTLTGVAPYELGSPVSAAMTIAPAPTGSVSVMPLDDFATERSATGANAGSFRLTRTGDPVLLASALTVSFTLTGTATNGSDYASPLQATFSAGTSTVDVVITPVADSTTEGTETVVLTLTAATPYQLGSPVSASLTISDVAPIVALTVPDATATELGATGRFVMFRSGDLSVPLTVTVVYSGTATNGADYDLPTTFTFDANEPWISVTVTAISDGLAEPAESVTMTMVDGDTYDLSGTLSRTVNIGASLAGT